MDLTNENLDVLLKALQGRIRTTNSELIREMGLQVERGRKEQAQIRRDQLAAVPADFKPKIEQDPDTGIVTASVEDHTVRVHAIELTEDLKDDLRIALYSKVERHNRKLA